MAETTYIDPTTGKPVSVEIGVNPDSLVVEGLDQLRSEVGSLNQQLTSRYTDLLTSGQSPSADPTYQALQKEFQTKSAQVKAMDNYVAAFKAGFSESGSKLLPTQGQSSTVISNPPSANLTDPPPLATQVNNYNQTTASTTPGTLPPKTIPITPNATQTSIQASAQQAVNDPPPSVNIPGNPEPANVDSASFATDAAIANDALERVVLPSPAINSAGAIVAGEAAGRIEGSYTQIPPVLPEYQTDIDIANFDLPQAGIITPTTGRVDSERQTNALPNELAEEAQAIGFSEDGVGPLPVPTRDEPEKNEATVGVSANEDITTNTASSPVSSQFVENIIPTPNSFNAYATMTYSVSIYLMGATQYASMISTGVKSVQGLTLLMQSGGARTASAETAQQSTATGNYYGAKRSKHFDLDFYIDDIELEGLISGTSVQSSHNVFALKFTIKEPNGLTFLDRLHAAVQDYMLTETQGQIETKNINYAAQNYLMVVRFYGYDINGEMMDGTKIAKQEPTSDAQAIVEKFIPFQFTGIKFQMTNRMIEYQCEAACPQSFVSMSDTHSRIPFNVELMGGTVQQILAGNNSNTESAAPQGEQTAATVLGLAEALNQEQEKQVKAGILTYPNKYIIEFEPNSQIGTKKVVKDGSTNKERSGMPAAKQDPASKIDPAKNKVEKEKRLYTIPAGTSIIQTIDTVIRNSEYITSQQNIIIDEVTGKPKIKEGAQQQTFQWYKIRTQVIPGKYDPKTNDYAYTVKYVISRYLPSDIKSPYFPVNVYRGVHKEYKYWFTGENTEILNFSQDFNYLYYQSFGPEMQNGVSLPEINTREISRRFYMPRSNETSVGGASSRSTEPAANAASILYSPGDQAMATLEIVGDPDWIAQSEIFYGPDVSFNEVGLGPFMKDGSINYDASEVYFSIEYKTPADYGDDGLLNTGYVYNPSGGNNNGIVSLAYRANEIKTYLKGGAFKQELKGTLMTYRDDPRIQQTDGGLLIADEANRRTSATQEAQSQDRQQLAAIANSDTDAENTMRMDTALEYDTNLDSEQTDQLLAQEHEFLEEDLGYDGNISSQQTVVESGIPATANDITDVEFEQAFAEQELVLMNDDTNLTAQTSTEPPLSTPVQPTIETNIAEPAQDVPVEQANNSFPTPQPPITGPGWTEQETLSRIPEGVTEDPLTAGTGDQMYYYKGKNISGRTQAELDAQIQAIDSGQSVTYDAYDPILNQRVRVNYDPVTDTTDEEGYYDEKTGKFIKV